MTSPDRSMQLLRYAIEDRISELANELLHWIEELEKFEALKAASLISPAHQQEEEGTGSACAADDTVRRQIWPVN